MLSVAEDQHGTSEDEGLFLYTDDNETEPPRQNQKNKQGTRKNDHSISFAQLKEKSIW